MEHVLRNLHIFSNSLDKLIKDILHSQRTWFIFLAYHRTTIANKIENSALGVIHFMSKYEGGSWDTQWSVKRLGLWYKP